MYERLDSIHLSNMDITHCLVANVGRGFPPHMLTIMKGYITMLHPEIFVPISQHTSVLLNTDQPHHLGSYQE